MNRQLVVTNAAVKGNDGIVYSVPKPGRHHNVLSIMYNNGLDKGYLAKAEQGFLLSSGSFAGRQEARKVAEIAGQLLDSAYDLNELFSEDVW